MNYAATIDPKSTPTNVRLLNQAPAAPAVKFTPRLNPVAPDFDPLAPDADLPPVPKYKQYEEPLQRSPVFDQLHKLFTERIAYIDGAMGTMIQRYKLEVRCTVIPLVWGLQLACVVTKHRLLMTSQIRSLITYAFRY